MDFIKLAVENVIDLPNTNEVVGFDGTVVQGCFTPDFRGNTLTHTATDTPYSYDYVPFELVGTTKEGLRLLLKEVDDQRSVAAIDDEEQQVLKEGLKLHHRLANHKEKQKLLKAGLKLHLRLEHNVGSKKQAVLVAKMKYLCEQLGLCIEDTPEDIPRLHRCMLLMAQLGSKKQKELKAKMNDLCEKLLLFIDDASRVRRWMFAANRRLGDFPWVTGRVGSKKHKMLVAKVEAMREKLCLLGGM